MNKLDKNFFIGSFLLHLFIILLLLIFNSNNNITRHFLVYGAHSKKPTHAYFKPLKNTAKTNWLQKRLNEQQKMDQLKKKPKKKNNLKPKKKPAKKNPPKKEKKEKAKNQKKPLEQKKKTQTKREKKQQSKKKKPKKKALEKEKKDTNPKVQANVLKEKSVTEKIKEQPAHQEEKEEELHFNLMGESDPTLAIYQKHIQKEVERLWRPPVGVPKGTECSIAFTINLEGMVERLDIIKRSQVLIYDLSIIRVAKKFQFDRCLWGKKFTIDFRQ